MDSASINVTNTIPTNVRSVVPINSDDKKVRHEIDYFILYTFLLVTILLFLITLICYYCTNYRSKQKIIDTLTI